MKVLFWGTPVFAVPTLRALSEEGHDVVGVVTQPDRRAGRGRKTTRSPVKRTALADGLPVLDPERPTGEAFLSSIRALEPDISVVVAYGNILSQEVLDVPRLGSLNVHASLLPVLRGAAPVHWAIIRGCEKTGVTVMRMVREMDAGPILLQEEEPIGPTETMTELAARLSEVGAVALVETLALLSVGGLAEREQDHGEATYAPKVDRETARVAWSRDAQDVANHIRGMDDSPGAWSMLAGEPVKLYRPRPRSDHPGGEAGVVLRADVVDGLLVAAGTGAVDVGEVQPPGKRRMSAIDWIRGRGVSPDDRFE
jgi:methionyl-tRNA formyltransferase